MLKLRNEREIVLSPVDALPEAPLARGVVIWSGKSSQILQPIQTTNAVNFGWVAFVGSRHPDRFSHWEQYVIICSTEYVTLPLATRF